MTPAEQERAAVVAWLRGVRRQVEHATIAEGLDLQARAVLTCIQIFTEAIERGDHIEAQAHLSKGSE